MCKIPFIIILVLIGCVELLDEGNVGAKNIVKSPAPTVRAPANIKIPSDNIVYKTTSTGSDMFISNLTYVVDEKIESDVHTMVFKIRK